MKPQETIGHAVKSLNNEIRRLIEKRASEDGKDNVATGMQGWIIGFVHHKNRQGTDIFQRDIENEFHIRRSTATGILQLMEKNELILRQPVPYDARLKKLVLTPKAEEHHRRIHKGIEKVDQQLRQGLTKSELATFFELMGKIMNNAQQG